MKNFLFTLLLNVLFAMYILVVPLCAAENPATPDKDKKNIPVTITAFVQVDGWPLWYSCIEKQGYTAEDIAHIKAKKAKGENVPPFQGELNLLKNEKIVATLKTGTFMSLDLQRSINEFNKTSKDILCPAEVELRTVSGSSGNYLPALYVKEVPRKF